MFSNIKYNLYEILNVPIDCDENKIKKSYLKLVKKFHPDKNNKLEEEIYFHIIYANQILSNKELRNKYNEFIKDTFDFNFLKIQSKNITNNISSNITEENKIEATILFNKNCAELNIKHGYCTPPIINDREEIHINKSINPKDMNEFNKLFLKEKINGTLKDQIIEYKGEPMEISTYVLDNNYTFINDIEKLYIDDNIGNNSLDIAFTLQPFTEI